MSQFKIENALIAREYLGQKDGILFFDSKMNYPVDELHVSSSFERDLVETLFWLISEENKKVRCLKAELVNMKRQNDILAEKMMLQKHKDKKLAFWGAGQKCRELIERMKASICLIIDNDEQKDGENIKGIDIIFSGKVIDWKEYYIVVTCMITEAIEEQLQALKLVKEEDYALAKDYFV